MRDKRPNSLTLLCPSNLTFSSECRVNDTISGVSFVHTEYRIHSKFVTNVRRSKNFKRLLPFEILLLPIDRCLSLSLALCLVAFLFSYSFIYFERIFVCVFWFWYFEDLLFSVAWENRILGKEWMKRRKKKLESAAISIDISEPLRLRVMCGVRPTKYQNGS